ncbi:unnamed protein product [Peniophora sp. CBMAI 1063]|nr:unnamed protein product [Peniophora sp. CBMAI 1063]
MNATIPFCAPTSPEARRVQEILDIEAREARLILAAVNERRNDFALPSLLPPEVLANVFSFLIKMEPLNLKPFYFDRMEIGWLKASHVCRRWRSTCLNQPSLWTRLRPDDSQPWAVFLERAKEASLYISGIKYTTSCFPHILAHQHQIRELVLPHIRIAHLHELVDGLSGPLPRLQALQLHCSLDTREGLPSLHPRFLSEIAPNLEDLSLHGVHFPWGEGSPKITRFDYGGDTRLSSAQQPNAVTPYSEVIRTIRQMPALRVLQLRATFPANVSNDAHLEPIALSQLQVLNVTDKHDGCWRFWAQLRIPSSATVSISCSKISAVDSLITASLSRHLRADTARLFISLHIASASHLQGGLSLHLASQPTNVVPVPGSRHPSVSLLTGSENGASLARQLLETISLENLQEVALCTGSIGGAQTLYNLYLPARSVTRLILGAGNASAGLEALLLPAYTVGSGVEGQILFPNLEHLQLSSVHFGEQNPRADGNSHPLHSTVNTVLAERSVLTGRPLPILQISGCDVRKNWVKSWEFLVDEVIWDCQEGEFEESDFDLALDFGGDEGMQYINTAGVHIV